MSVPIFCLINMFFVNSKNFAQGLVKSSASPAAHAMILSLRRRRVATWFITNTGVVSRNRGPRYNNHDNGCCRSKAIFCGIVDVDPKNRTTRKAGCGTSRAKMKKRGRSQTIVVDSRVLLFLFLQQFFEFYLYYVLLLRIDATTPCFSYFNFRYINYVVVIVIYLTSLNRRKSL